MLVTFLWVSFLCYHNYQKSQDRFWIIFNESHFQQTELVSKLFFSHGSAQLISGTDSIHQVFVTETVTRFVLIRTGDLLLCKE